MPRKGTMTQNFNPAFKDATHKDILDALGKNKTTIKDGLEEVGQTLKSTHLGHELHLWDAEVEAE